MNDKLSQDLIHSLFLYRKVTFAISHSLSIANGSGLSAAELLALTRILKENEKGNDTADQTDHYLMHETLAVSKAAISQMLGSLEKRGFIRREINIDNRRKIIITVTKKGRTAVEKGKKHMDAMILRVIEQFGEKNTRDFVKLMDSFTEIVNNNS